MTILVTYASKHESTQGIAERIARKLRQLEQDAVVLPIEAVGDTEASTYSAFVIGSAVYYGSWLKDATEFVRHNRAALAKRPVWLFSSGPLGTEVKDTEPQPKEIAELREALHPRDHRIFYGALDHTKLSFPERMVVKAVRAPEGDFRNWGEIDGWAEEIAHTLASTGVTTS